MILPVSAQDNPPAVSLSGDFGFYGELYQVDGIRARRPDNTWNIYFRPTITIQGIDLPFEFLISSEDEQFRQPVNRFTFKPRWGWGGLQLGDFNARHSEFSLNAIRMRGGGIALEPGIFRLAFAAGRSQRGVAGDSLQQRAGAFERNLYAVKIGIGRESGSYLDFNFMKSEDDTASADSSVTARPQENVVAAVAGQLTLFQRQLKIRGEAAAGAFTRDLRNSKFDVEDIPSSAEDIFTPRLSSRLSAAFRLQGEYLYRSAGLLFNFRRINPGFVSHGTAYLINDLQAWNIAPRIRLVQNRWSIRTSFGIRRDNLEDDKRFTTTRRQFMLSSNWRASRQVSISGGYNRYDLSNDAALPAERLEHLSQSFNLRPRFTFTSGRIRHLVSTGLQIQLIDVQNGTSLPLGATDVYHYRLDWTVQPSRIWSATPGFIYQENRLAAGNMRILSYTLGGTAQLWKNKLSSSLNVSIIRTRDVQQTSSTQTGILGSLLFRPTRLDRFLLKFRNTDQRQGGSLVPAFTEIRASLQYSRSF